MLPNMPLIYLFWGTDITRELCLGAHNPQRNTYHCNIGAYICFWFNSLLISWQIKIPLILMKLAPAFQCHWALPYIVSYPDQLKSIKQHCDFPRKFTMPFPFIGGKYANFWSLCIYWFCSVAYLDYKWILTLGCTYQQQQSSYYFENHAWIYFCLCEQQPSNVCKPEIYAAFLVYIIYMYVSIHTFYVQNHYLFVCLFVSLDFLRSTLSLQEHQLYCTWYSGFEENLMLQRKLCQFLYSVTKQVSLLWAFS